jgi:hypothetical protein
MIAGLIGAMAAAGMFGGRGLGLGDKGDKGSAETGGNFFGSGQSFSDEMADLRSDITSGLSRAKGDISYGLGLSKDKPAGYDARTAASMERSAANQAEFEGNAPTPEEIKKGTRPKEEDDADTADGASDVAVPGAGEPLKGSGVSGQAEADAAKSGKKGRKSTIMTGPQGLLADPAVRPKRSLMGLIQ